MDEYKEDRYPMKRKTIHTQNAPAALGPYEQAVKAGHFLFTSGQLGINPASGNLEEGLEMQARAAMQNLGHILKEAGLGYDDIIKTTIFMTDLAGFAAVNEVYGSFFAKSKPARSTVQVAALPKGGLVEIECVALADD
jgi:2-iminobutanoate/2-iminopropanoate deaminase